MKYTIWKNKNAPLSYYEIKIKFKINKIYGDLFGY